MCVPPLRLHNNFESYISGEVIVHPTAVIAPGVILLAAPNSKIIIGSGVCIGMGSILQVHEGILEVEAGANLGAGFLMVGKGKIGANACVGSATTVFNCSIEPGQVVAPGSVLGDTSRIITASDEEATGELTPPTNPTPDSPQEQKEEDTGTGEQEDTGNSSSNSAASPPQQSTLNTQDSESTQDSDQSATESSNNFGTVIYGQGSIQQLLITLFPHRQSLSKPHSDDESK